MSDKKTKWNDFDDLATSDELEAYFQARNEAFDNVGRTKYFSHYTSLKTLNEIFAGKSLLFSSVNGFNDESDKKQFPEKDRSKYFSLCFCGGEEENLSLWYLYSGIHGTGGRIIISQAKLRNLLNKPTFTLYDMEAKQDVVRLDENDYTLEKRDILYFKRNGKRVNLRFNSRTNFGKVTYDEFKKYKRKHKGFFKNIIWHYENEKRIIIKLSDQIVAKCKPETNYAIKMNIESIIDNVKIQLAPEIKQKKYIKEYPDLFKIFKNDGTRLLLSENKGQVKMNLCDKCEHKCFKKDCCDRIKETDKK